ncbi:hypothetical protein YerA41_042 [Yersinia phage YerA41]|nr:hypothetical protein YerA41_042 [Yersinia phage YerA41]
MDNFEVNAEWVEITDLDSLIQSSHNRLMVYNKNNKSLYSGFSEWCDVDGSMVLLCVTNIEDQNDIIEGLPIDQSVIDEFRWFTFKYSVPEFDPVKFGLELN